MAQANLFIGLGLLSTAYALKLGGWAALLGLAVNAGFFAMAGDLCSDLAVLSHAWGSAYAIICTHHIADAAI